MARGGRRAAVARGEEAEKCMHVLLKACSSHVMLSVNLRQNISSYVCGMLGRPSGVGGYL